MFFIVRLYGRISIELPLVKWFQQTCICSLNQRNLESYYSEIEKMRLLLLECCFGICCIYCTCTYLMDTESLVRAIFTGGFLFVFGQMPLLGFWNFFHGRGIDDESLSGMGYFLHLLLIMGLLSFLGYEISIEATFGEVLTQLILVGAASYIIIIGPYIRYKDGDGYWEGPTLD